MSWLLAAGGRRTALGADVFAIVEQEGGETLDGPNQVPTGRNLTILHPGGAVIEYVEFDPTEVQGHVPR